MRHLLKQSGPLQEKQVIRLGLHLLEALVMAEDVHIVHRDVKPENIICDSKGDFWLLDFGIARHLQLESQTPSAAPFGKVTWGYAPPEQCRNFKRDIDARADLFALGVTLFECAIGTNPFCDQARDKLEILKRVETMRLQPVNLRLPGAEKFRDLIDAMTQKRRDHRPRSAAEALAWIEEVCTEAGV